MTGVYASPTTQRSPRTDRCEIDMVEATNRFGGVPKSLGQDTPSSREAERLRAGDLRRGGHC